MHPENFFFDRLDIFWYYLEYSIHTREYSIYTS